MNFPSLNEQIDVIKRGTVEIIPEDELVKKIEKSIAKKIPLNVKLGCDPSRPDLHIGHAVVLNKLRQFQELGHTAILIIGDYTGMIGDPTGKKKTRPQLTYEEARENGKTYYDQAVKILDKDKTKILYNSDWLAKLNLQNLIELMSKFTVQRILERDDFTNRLNEQAEIAFHEMLYPLMQGYDSYAINSDVELGGTDQKFNNLMGRDVQKRFGREPQIVITMPLLEGIDGSEKMSKSLDNAIGISEDPKDIFGKTMRIPDNLIYKYFELGTQISVGELKELTEKIAESPRDYKRKLGFEIVKLYYDEPTAERAVEEFDKIFIKKEIPDDIPETMLREDIKLINLIVANKMADSNSAARKLIEAGAVSIDGEKVGDVNFLIEKDKKFTLKVGKRKFLKVN
ncbi:MAG: tyrosine--tRNA ligase [Ignavibacteria bacterium]|nr:tyrosine--tRNA ligase [Ignavibacteria bacterium]